MERAIRRTREQEQSDAEFHAGARFAAERRIQLLSLLALAAMVLIATVLYAGLGNVFPPNWWHLG